MNTQKTRTLFFVLLLVLTACQKWDLEATDFPQLTWQDLRVNSLFSITLEANTAGLAGGTFSEHGFLYSTNDEEPGISKINTTKINLGSSVSNENFSHRLSDLTINTVYFLRAYAIYESAVKYTEVIRYDNKSSLQVLTQNTSILAGENTGIVSGSIGQIPPGLLVERYGHCWSTQNTEPTILGTATNLGSTDQDTANFTITLTDMEPLRPYYVRAYAVVDGIAVYGEVVALTKKDAWEQKSNFPREDIGATPMTFMIDDEIHAIVWPVWDDFHQHYVYDISEDQWTHLGKVDISLMDSQGACSVGGKGYVGMGRGIFSGEITRDLWEYNSNKEWCKKQPFPGTPRILGTMIGLNDKVYFGTGEKEGNEYFTDFWEFDPNDESNGFNACGDPMGSWKQLPDFLGGERSSAGYFVYDGKAYVGGGTTPPNTNQFAFWEFEPNNNPEWVEKQTFDRLERWEAAAFVINDKAYYGLGSFFGVDYHEFDPLDTINGYDVKGQPMGSWKQVNNFGGPARYGADAYAFDGKGYVVFGFAGNNVYFPEVWAYSPDVF